MRALVAFGTKYGSTIKVGEEIGRVLREKGLEVEVVNLDERKVHDLAPYDLVVVGSAIIIGKWTKGARTFLEQNQASLRGKRLAMFACCGDVLAETKERREGAKARYLDQVVMDNGFKPLDLALFGGELDFNKYGFLIKAVLKDDRRHIESGGVDLSKPYDYRDWDAIRAWAREVADEALGCTISEIANRMIEVGP
jgi:menaquinone-dependent protoporphyrinogen oxidase